VDTTVETIDCACVIHGDAYSWQYVETLYNMLSRHLTPKVRLHVYTEADREVPAPFIKHELTNWEIGGPRRAWWYKMQLFNTEHHAGPLLYFDLDTVIVNNIDWIWKQPLKYFWTVRDFKYLWRPNFCGINSSVMWWDTRNYNAIWQAFQRQDLLTIMRKYHGDQDYITTAIGHADRRFFDTDQVKSWRWECLDGGYEFSKKRYFCPNTGTQLTNKTSILIFHGNPKPHKVDDSAIVQHWI
jgi:hypothetical protein